MPFRFAPLRSQVSCESITGERARVMIRRWHIKDILTGLLVMVLSVIALAIILVAVLFIYKRDIAISPLYLLGSRYYVRGWFLLVLAAFVSTQSTAQALFQCDDHCQEYGGRNRSDGPISDRIRCVGLDSDSSASSCSCRYRCACAPLLARAPSVLSGRLLLGISTDIKAAFDVDRRHGPMKGPVLQT